MNEERVEPVESSAPRDDAEAAVSRIGTVVDKYTIVRLLGRGGMGAVYEARHAKLARRVGIKFLLPELAANRDVLRRFENEAKAAGGLEHPNLVAVTDVGRADDGAPFLVMEYLEGEDCSKLLRRTGCLPVPRATDIVLQACRGLAIAHKAAIVHRDLKPENLFVTAAGDGSDLIKVLDFGIAKLRPTDASVVTGTGAMFGTAFYMSPEQARGAGEVDPRTDVWSLGVVLYELLSGRRPFEGEQFLQVIHQILSVAPPPLAKLRPGLPVKLGALVEWAMAKEAGDRLPSVLAFAEALLPFAGRTANAQGVMSAEALAATRATPATRTGEAPGSSANRSGISFAAPPSGSTATAKAAAPPSTRRPARLAAGAIVVAAIVGGAAYWQARRNATSAAATSNLGAEAARAAPAPRPAASALAVPPTPTPTPPVAASRVAPPLPKTNRTPAPRPDRGSERRGARTVASGRPVEVAPPAADVPRAPPTVAPASAGHPIEIEKDNPYGP